MGVTVSHTALAPISMASSIIGFISFGFTLATFLNVFWSSVQTIHAAPSEIPDYLSNLKQGLLGQRQHLRKVRKECAARDGMLAVRTTMAKVAEAGEEEGRVDV